ncbi:MAG: hypothetical protein ACXW1U_15985 [Methylobacter sp.]
MTSDECPNQNIRQSVSFCLMLGFAAETESKGRTTRFVECQKHRIFTNHAPCRKNELEEYLGSRYLIKKANKFKEAKQNLEANKTDNNMHMESNIINEITAYAAVASALVTFFLTLITAWYAYHTQRMVGEMKDGRIKAPMPIISCNVEFVDEDKSEEEIYQYNIYVKNVGNSPAIETTVLFKFIASDNTMFQDGECFVGVVGVGEYQTLVITPDSVSTAYVDNIDITATSKNVYGVVSKSTASFKVVYPNSVCVTGGRNLYRYVKLKEAVTYASVA